MKVCFLRKFASSMIFASEAFRWASLICLQNAAGSDAVCRTDLLVQSSRLALARGMVAVTVERGEVVSVRMLVFDMWDRRSGRVVGIPGFI